MTKVGIVVNAKKSGALELLAKLRRWLEERRVRVTDTTAAPAAAVLGDAELIVCLGGDGTLLSVADQMNGRPVPILGVNLGALGFLTEVKQDEVFEELDIFFAGRGRTEKRLMLSCRASIAGGREKKLTALNDIVVSREGLSRILRLEVDVSEEKLTSFAGDGVIVSTPTGSTAYSLSAGGAVVHPKLEAMIITPICAHALSLRPIVVPADEKIRVRVQPGGGAGRALLTADGQENLEIDDSFNVEITKAGHALTLVKSSKRTYFAALRENFKLPD